MYKCEGCFKNSVGELHNCIFFDGGFEEEGISYVEKVRAKDCPLSGKSVMKLIHKEPVKRYIKPGETVRIIGQFEVAYNGFDGLGIGATKCIERVMCGSKDCEQDGKGYFLEECDC